MAINYYTQNNEDQTFVGIANSEDNFGNGSVRFVIKGNGKLPPNKQLLETKLKTLIFWIMGHNFTVPLVYDAN